MCSALSFGQGGLASITGTVTDATGAVVANAPISIRNTQNGTVSTAASSNTGNYNISQLPVGDYDLTIALTGFKTYNHSNFHLVAGQIMREDITLEVGQTTESITVTAEASLLKTESTEVSQNVTLTQLQNLPILTVGATNSGFRDPFSSVRLVPGIRYAGGSNIGSGAPAAVTILVVNGTPANTAQTRLDGMTDNPTGPRLLGAQQETQPSVDAIEEVAMETSNFAAEYGTAGGAMINMVTKSGTNSYHGTVYDYLVNEALNAHQPYTGTRNVVKQNDWGYTIGGPVQIPKIYDGKNKSFFFFSYEQFRNKNINISNTTTTPLPAYLNGDFSNLITAENRLITKAQGATSVPVTDALGRQIQSGTVFDPNSQAVAANGVAYRNPFPGNQVPVARFDPITAKILPMFPAPLGINASRGQASNNYQGTYDSSRVSAIPSIKFDQNIGSKGRMSIYYQDTHTLVPRTPTGADAFNDTITQSVLSASSGQTIRATYDYTATSRLILHFGAGWNDSDFKLAPANNHYDAVKQLGLVGQTKAAYFPRIGLAVNGNTAIGGSSSLGQFFPSRSFERRPSATVAATYVAGSHTFKFGADWRLEKYPNILDVNTNGTWNFGTNMTEQPSLQGVPTNQGFDGFEFASFLLGGMSSNTLNAPIALSNNKLQAAVYAQDTWKVTRKLTLDYGLRWDYGTYAHEQFGRNGSIGLNIPNPSASGRLGANQFEANCGCKFAQNYPFAFGPRIGLAYQLDRKTVLRAGFGVIYNATSTASGSNTSGSQTSSLPANSGLITGLFKNGMPASVQPQWPSYDPGVGQGFGSVIAMPALLDPNAGRPARQLQWNVGIQREINRNLVVEASYVANRGIWWTAAGLSPLNQISLGTLQSLGFKNFADPNEAKLLTTTITNLTTAQRSTLAARGITGVPYTGFPTGGQTIRQSLRPYPQYNSNGLQGAPLGNTWYDSFQLNVTQRFSHGLSANMNYNYSKNLDLMGAVDPFNRANGKNLSVWDLPQQFRLTIQYVVPQLREGSLPYVTSNKVVAYALSGWGIGAYLNYQSAGLVTRPSSNGSTPISQFLGYGPGSAQQKLNADGTPMNPWSVDWTDYSGKHHTDPLDINCHCFDITKTQVLNPNAWTNVPDGTFAADQTSIRQFRGQRQPMESMNFSRNFRFKERVNLNVRIEFQNIFNRMQFPAITSGNFATSVTKFTSGANAGLNSGGFGTLNPLAGTSGQRTGSIVARITF